MDTILSVAQVLIAIAMIAIILVQRGAGAAAGSGFGAGASATVFGSRGSGSFLTRTTAILATLFFVISLTMAIIAGNTNFEADADDLGVMAGAAETSDVPEVPTMGAVADEGGSDIPTLPAEATEAEDTAVEAEAPPPQSEDENGDG